MEFEISNLKFSKKVARRQNEEDPYELNSQSPIKEREVEKFQQVQKALGINMAVVSFMREALEFFSGKHIEEVKKIAFEIAMQGIHGYKPEVENYRISAMPGKTFSGYKILAFFYVSWALAIPDMLSQLQLPYDKEFELAQSLFRDNGN